MNAVETEARIQRLLSGDVGEPVPGSDFDIVLDALRNARIDVGTLQHLVDAATDELARVNADFDLTASAAARVVVERDRAVAERNYLQARLSIEAERAPRPERARESVASALAAFDLVTRNGIGTGSGVLSALRSAAIREDVPEALTSTALALIAACRAHVAREGRSEASDGFGLGSVGGAA